MIGVARLRRWAKRRLEATGQRFPVFLTVGADHHRRRRSWSILCRARTSTWTVPALSGFNFKGGFAAAAGTDRARSSASRSITATFIGENVRAGIQAVSHGQTEAAQSLGHQGQ